ncbi:MAG TPA: ribosome silencing factor [Anaerolineae bacterium]|nr:ribosome silencing factor [Anaerolineae bacterium]
MIEVLEEKKGEDIVLLDIKQITTLANYFIICSGSTDRMLDALSRAVNDRVRKEYGMRAKLEGLPQDGWILADYGQVIVHIFSPTRRDYYQLEQLWSDGKVLLHVQ